MTLKPWTLAAICLCALLVGGFVACRSTPNAQNTITVDVEDGSNKINLAPKKGDVIKWVDQANHPVTVKFLTNSPCEEIKKPSDTTDTCTVAVEGGNFQYACSGSTTCVDPGVDPRSSSSGTLARSPGVPAPPTGAGSVIAAISCPDTSAPPVITWSPDPPGSSVTVGQNIIWKAGSLNFTVTGFKYQNNQIQLCSQSTIDQNYHTCTVVQASGQTPPYMVSYTVTTSGQGSCGSASPTLTVNPASPTPLAAPKG
jgi:hypothetical protein